MAFPRPKKRFYSEEELYEYAVGALARRMRTVAELKRLLRVRGMVEKPSAAEAPSHLGIMGRYVLSPEIFECIAKVTPGWLVNRPTFSNTPTAGPVRACGGMRKFTCSTPATSPGAAPA